jgi:aryl-alcohol dehydrogenase-like predicted oxidoreductase
MEYRSLGKTNLSVSEIGHGLWGMGGWTDADDKQSLDTLQMSLEMGWFFFSFLDKLL